MLLMSWVCIELSTHVYSLRSRRLEVMGARKNGAREGDMRGERELPLSSSVSLVLPVRRLQQRLLFFSPFNFFNVFPFIYDQVFFFFQILKYKVLFLPQFSKNTLLNTWTVISIWRRICSK